MLKKTDRIDIIHRASEKEGSFRKTIEILAIGEFVGWHRHNHKK